MGVIAYVTVPFALEDDIGPRRGARLAKETKDAIMIQLDPQQIGLLKERDLAFDLPDPSYHIHHAPPGEACLSGENNCRDRCMDGVYFIEDDD